MTWFEAFRLALAILQIIKEWQKGQEADKEKMESIAVNALPQKYKVKLSELTPEEITEVTDLFLK
jgi:hypothetical protein